MSARMADKNGKNATVKRPAVKPPVASFRFDQLAGQIGESGKVLGPS
jgi:hypothetical protein